MTASLTDTTGSARSVIDRYSRHVNPAFVKLLGTLGYGRLFVRARDVWLWDHQGRQYLDALAGFGSVNIGHNHPRLVERLKVFLAEEALNLSHTGPSAHTALLAEELARLADPLTVCLFANSGAEAVEAGLKLARAATGKPGLLSCAGGFHGTNLGTLSVMGEDRMRKPFEPLLPGCQRVPFGDLEALKKHLAGGRMAAFLVESIQAEAGVHLPPPGYLSEAQELCRRHGTLLVLDEVQTGLGRSGTLFAYQAEGFVPDVLVLAKSLGGSLAPISVTLTRPEIQARAYGSMDRFDLHGSTFAGNALACVAVTETLHILAEEDLCANSQARGAELLAGLVQRLAGHPLVRAVRGRGLLVGIELGPTDIGLTNRLSPGLVEMISRRVFGQWVALRLLERGIVCQPASQQWNVLKLEPPLTIRPEQVSQLVENLTEVLDEYRGLVPILRDVTERLIRQFLAGWRFTDQP
jgi:putrescine aminotransferase